MAQQGFYFDSSRCVGCKTCELTCKDYKDLGPEILYRRVYDYEGGTWKQDDRGLWTTGAYVYHLSLSCNHCAEPACVAACPTGAMQKDADTGLVFTDKEACIGCMSCQKACPYDAPRLNEQLSVSRKCDGCIARVKAGKQPICVESCPMRALEFGDVEELREKYGDLDQIEPMPEPSTAPSLVLKACSAVDAAATDTPFLANPLEVE